MKIAIMQPYLFPYIGYFQLIHAVDLFVIYDDAYYINRGWINRNRILQGDRFRFITLSLVGASQNKLINDILIQNESQKKNRIRIINIIKEAYARAPYFKNVFPLIESIVMNKEGKLSSYLEYSIDALMNFLNIKRVLLRSSSIKKESTLKGELKIIDICKRLGAREYYNPIGGMSLYDKNIFSMSGMELNFIHTKEISYPQFGKDFIPNLSIIDILMFNDVDTIDKMIEQYEF